jgi:hypothetical protein
MAAALAERLDRLLSREAAAESIDRHVGPPPVASMTACPTCSGERPRALTVASAPSSRALASLLSKTSTATTIPSIAVAICTAERPIPPHPCTATHSPGCTRPRCTTARYDVMKRQPSAAADRVSTPSGSRMQFRSARRDGDVLCPTAGTIDRRNDPVVAKIGEPRATLWTRAVSFVERDRHAVTDLDGAHIASDFHDDTANFVAHHRGERDVEADPCPILVPEVPVAAADPACFHLHQGPIAPRCHDWNLGHTQRTPERRHLRRAHSTGPDRGCGPSRAHRFGSERAALCERQASHSGCAMLVELTSGDHRSVLRAK